MSNVYAVTHLLHRAFLNTTITWDEYELALKELSELSGIPIVMRADGYVIISPPPTRPRRSAIWNSGEQNRLT